MKNKNPKGEEKKQRITKNVLYKNLIKLAYLKIS